VCRSPKLIAAYHGLHRLRVPRHPPHAFTRLTTTICVQAELLRSNNFNFVRVTICSIQRSMLQRATFPLPLRRAVGRNRSLSTRILKSAIYHYFRCQIAMTLAARESQGVNARNRIREFGCVEASDLRRFSIGSALREPKFEERPIYSRSVKEVIQPQVPLRLPCYDFAPVTALAFGRLPPCGLLHGLRALTASMA
jgi:hypothetical protein